MPPLLRGLWQCVRCMSVSRRLHTKYGRIAIHHSPHSNYTTIPRILVYGVSTNATEQGFANLTSISANSVDTRE